MHDRSGPRAAGFGGRSLFVFLAFAAIALFFLLSEHRVHALGWLPFLLLFAACPLLHFFMHGSHGHGGHGSAEREPSPDSRKDLT